MGGRGASGNAGSSGKGPSSHSAAGMIKSAYERLAARTRPGSGVSFTALRNELGGLSNSQFDSGVKELSDYHGVHVRAEADQKTLTPQDRAGAIKFGGTDRHLLLIERGGAKQRRPAWGSQVDK